MKHSWTLLNDNLTVEYRWKKKKWNSLKINADNSLTSIVKGSEEEFITEHYWGYTKISNKRTSEYRVEHPRWDIYKTRDYSIDVDFADIYGQEFDFLKNEKPKSVFLAEGSEIKVMNGQVI